MGPEKKKRPQDGQRILNIQESIGKGSRRQKQKRKRPQEMQRTLKTKEGMWKERNNERQRLPSISRSSRIRLCYHRVMTTVIAIPRSAIVLPFQHLYHQAIPLTTTKTEDTSIWWN